MTLKEKVEVTRFHRRNARYGYPLRCIHDEVLRLEHEVSRYVKIR